MGSGQHETSYIHGLDLIRFTAALMVVFLHLSWQQHDAQITFDPGWVGVEIFFCISGFVIMSSAVGVSPIRFLERRFARLYPAAIACALINYAVLHPFSVVAIRYGLRVNASLTTLTHSILLIKDPFLVSAMWTLPIELAFYGLVALMLIFKWGSRMTTLAGLLIVSSGLYVIPFALSEYGIGPVHVNPLGYGMLNLTMLRHGCFFGVGILLCQVVNRVPHTKVILLLTLGVLLCWIEIVARSAETAPGYAHSIKVAFLAWEAVVIFSLAIFAIWAFARLNNRLQLSPASKAVLRQMGLLTYPLYLMHEGVGGVAYSLLRARNHAQGIALLSGLALTLVASLLVVQAVEPWLRRRLLTRLHPMLEQLTANPRVAQTIGKFTARA